jgi:hypothetical protein
MKVNLENKRLKIIVILIIVLAFTRTFITTFLFPDPLGDWVFHIKIARDYAAGKFAMLDPVWIAFNRMPYPPLFHLFLVPSVLLGIEKQFAFGFQLFAFPIALILTMFFVYKLRGLKQAVYVGLLLLASNAYFDRSFQANPQAFDMIFLPLSYLFFFKKSVIPFLITSLVMIYSHGIPALLLLGPLILYGNIKIITILLVLSLPIVILSIYYLPGSLQVFKSDVNNQQAYLKQNVGAITPFLGLPLVLLSFTIPFGYYFKRHVNNSIRKVMFDHLDKIMILLIICIIPMLFLWFERFFMFLAIPLSVLIAGTLDKWPFKVITYTWLILLIVLAVLNIGTILSIQYFLTRL